MFCVSHQQAALHLGASESKRLSGWGDMYLGIIQIYAIRSDYRYCSLHQPERS